MSRDFSRDETEWGEFGDSWGATLAPKLSGSVNVSLPGTDLQAPTAAQKAAAATLTATKLDPSLSVLRTSSAAAPSAMTAALAQLATKHPIVPNKALSAPAAAIVTAVKPAPVPTPRVSSAPSGTGMDPRTADFLNGQTLALPAVKPVPMTPEEQRAANAARIQRDAEEGSVINAQYRKDRAASDQDALRLNNVIAVAPWNTAGSGAWNFAGQDWGLIPLGAQVIATGAAIIATAGAAAPVIAGGAASIATLSSVVTADALLAKASSLGGEKAQAAIDATRKLAAGGDIDAQKGLTLLATVAADRVSKGVPDGVTQTKAALQPLALNPILAAATGGQPMTVRNDAGGTGGTLTADQLAAARPKYAVISSAKAPDPRLAVDTLALTPAAAAAAADARLRWTVLDSGKLYRGAAPSKSGGQFRVYDSGRVVHADG
jgi:hypothetical protein